MELKLKFINFIEVSCYPCASYYWNSMTCLIWESGITILFFLRLTSSTQLQGSGASPLRNGPT